MMGCSSCSGAAKAAAQYPREIVLSDGTKVTVASAAQERTERERARQRERANAKSKGYTTDR
jgi:hypothetical protein